MSFLGLIAVALAILVGRGFWLRQPWLAGMAGGLLGGPLLYLLVGGKLARGRGHFYSWPFGGMAVTDAALVASLAFWVLLAGLLVGGVAAVFRRA